MLILLTPLHLALLRPGAGGVAGGVGLHAERILRARDLAAQVFGEETAADEKMKISFSIVLFLLYYCTGPGKIMVPRLREFFRQGQAEVVSNSKNKILAYWEPFFCRAL